MALKPLKKKGKPLSKSTSTDKGKSKAFAGFRRAEENNKRAAAAREMYNERLRRVRVEVGKSRKVILLDKEPFFFYEHHYENKPGVWGGFIRCRKEVGDCAACDVFKEGTYMMMVTCIDLTPYKNKEGKTIKRSRMFLAVKSSMIPKYARLYKKHGSFRGLMLELTRDSNKEQSSGGSIEFIKKLTEDQIAAYGTELTKIPDYAKAFPMPTEEEMRKQLNVGRKAGKEDFADEDTENLDDMDDENPF